MASISPQLEAILWQELVSYPLYIAIELTITRYFFMYRVDNAYVNTALCGKHRFHFITAHWFI